MKSDRPDLYAIACEAGGYDPRSFEAGYRLAADAKLLAELPTQRAHARVTTWRALMPALVAIADAVGYDVTDEATLDDDIETTDPDVVSLVLSPKDAVMLAFTHNVVDLVFAAAMVVLLGVAWFMSGRPRRTPVRRDPWREAALTERARMVGAARRARRQQRWARLRSIL